MTEIVWLHAREVLDSRGNPTIEPDLGRAVELAQTGAGTVLVTGSFHTVGDVMHLLGLE